MNPDQTDLVIRNDDLVTEIVDLCEPRVHDAATRSALLAVGRIALIECADRFESGAPSSFATFARPRIREAVSTAASERRPRASDSIPDEVTPDESTLAAAIKLTVPQLRRIRPRVPESSRGRRY